jgi:hypothetical protein
MAGGGVNASAWVTPDGSDSDFYSWEDFTLAETQTITEVRWRGGYKYGAPYGKAVDFRISFFDSIAGGSQPVITALPEHESQEVVIATFHTNDNAGETYAGVSGGVTMYDYRFRLPTPVTLQGGVKYWFRVVAAQPYGAYPDWGQATSAPGSHFAYNQGAHMFQNWPNDLSFSLHADWADLGQRLAGGPGLPQLTGTGALTPGNPVSIDLTNALGGAPAFLFLGLSPLNFSPFYGGTLVPDFTVPPGQIIIVFTDGGGAVSLGTNWPAGVPSGFELYLQYWISDPGGPYGFSASNALQAVAP